MAPQISPIERLKDSRVQCTVTFERDEVVMTEKETLKRLSEQISLPGFRPGKVPPEIAREHIKEDQLLEEMVRTLVPGIVTPLVKEEKVQPILHPKVELQSRDPLTLQITFVEHPSVKVEASTINVPKIPPKVDQKDMDRMISHVLEQHKKTATVDRAAVEGDQITMDFRGVDAQSKEIPDTAMTGYHVRLGSKSLIPGFEDALLGLKKGDDTTFTLTFPEKYHAKHLCGQPVTFSVHVTDVEEVSLPELTDTFAKEQLGAQSADDFRTRVRESMVMQEEQIDRSRREQALIDAIEKATTVALAPELIEEEEQQLIEDLMRRLHGQKITLDAYLKENNQSREEFLQDMQKRATSRLKVRFGIEKLIEEKLIAITESDIEKAATQMLSRIPSEERPRIEPLYKKGERNYQQLEWQMKVEALIERMLA